MGTHYSRLDIGDMIYFINSHGFKHPYIVGQILYSKNNDVEYRNHIGTRICYEWELDNINSESGNYYFTSKTKRDNFIKICLYN